MEMSQKEKSILTLFKELSEREERVLTMYFGLRGKPKTTLVEIGQDFDLKVKDVLQIKNDGIRNFINMIVSTENYHITFQKDFLNQRILIFWTIS